MSDSLIKLITRGMHGLLKGLGVTLRNNFRRTVTIQYGYAPRWSKPEVRVIAPRFRGAFALIREPETGELRCTGCGICAQACPGRCITVSGEARKVTAYRLELDKCLYCGLCVEACPFEALGMSQALVAPTREHAALHLSLESLAQPVGAPMPGYLPSTAGGEVRPGKKPFVPKPAKGPAGQAKEEGSV
jgi:NADH-quinone oxidoreductase subunit I